MREGECVRDFTQDADGIGDRKRTFALQTRANGLAFDKRHYIVEKPIRCPRIVNRKDVWVLQIRGGADFARESVDAERLSQLRPKNLDRYGPVVPEIAGKIDGRGTAFTELALDAIAVLQGAAKAGENGVGQRRTPALGEVRG